MTPPLAAPWLADLVSWWDGMERSIVHCVTCRFYVPWLDPILIGVQSQTLGIVLAGVVMLLLILHSRPRGLRALLAAGIALGVGMGLATVLWATIDRPRPPQAYAVVLESPAQLEHCDDHPDALPLRMTRARSPSFPSRHGISVGVLVTVFLIAWRPLGRVALLYGALVAYGRVYAGKHWPSDVLAGVTIGALLAWAAWRLVPRILAALGWGRFVHEEPPDPAQAGGG